jgi:hypothetical protein
MGHPIIQGGVRMGHPAYARMMGGGAQFRVVLTMWRRYDLLDDSCTGGRFALCANAHISKSRYGHPDVSAFRCKPPAHPPPHVQAIGHPRVPNYNYIPWRVQQVHRSEKASVRMSCVGG